MDSLKSGSRSANQLRHLKQLFNCHSSAGRAISTTTTATAPPSFLRHLSPHNQPLLTPCSSSVMAIRHLRTGRDPKGGFEERYEQNPGIIVPEWEAYVIERSGKYVKTLTAGTYQNDPELGRIAYILSLKEGPFSVAHQTAVTKDNVAISINGDLFLKIVNPKLASYAVEKPKDALINLARTTIQSEVGKMTLEETQSEWKVLNEKIASAINETAKEWGLECSRSEMKKKTLPQEKKVLAVAKPQIIRAELEKLADKFFSDATNVLASKAGKVSGPNLKAEWERIANSVAEKLERYLKGEEEPIVKMNQILKEGGGGERLREDHTLWPEIRRARNKKAEFIEIVPEGKAYVVERSGKYLKTILTEGAHELDPFKDIITYEYSLEEHFVRNSQPHVVTKDNATVSVSGTLCVKVVDPKLASYVIINPIDALIECANSTLQSKFREIRVDGILLEKSDTLNEEIRAAIDEAAKGWGLQCVSYEIDRISDRALLGDYTYFSS
ncbi:OLC1v1002233C1 [Oldenlandia corymbosa var. corymbosa]|uniref:OLC1v1002233C1 n=1 Tax=Oldenlandia corymbosa var. corymbosa TaxID=529605 RepID=A0AAV1D7B7_OLDCO|nr:OLC1v1002233C1 [Oldenlandia corymbosa var. corymbosa]